MFLHLSVSHSVHRGRGTPLPHGYYEMRSMTGGYAYYWNAFLLLLKNYLSAVIYLFLYSCVSYNGVFSLGETNTGMGVGTRRLGNNRSWPLRWFT